MVSAPLTPERVTDLALAAIDAVARPESWPVFCDSLTDAMEARAFFLFAYDPANQAIPHVHGSRAIRGAAGQALARAARQGAGHEDDVVYARLAQQKHGEVFVEHAMLDLTEDQDLPYNPWRDRVLDVTGGRRRLVMKVNDSGPHLDCVAVHDVSQGGGVSRFARVAPFVYPIIARTLESSRIVAALSQSFERLLTLFDRLDFGAAFCTAEGRKIVGNATFAHILADRDGLREDGRGLWQDGSEGHDGLRRMLEAATRPEAPPEALICTLPRRSGRLPLIASALPARDARVHSSTTVLLTVIDPEERIHIGVRGLRGLGVLSAAELEVCDLIVRGFDTRAVADRRGTTAGTTRDQIKAASAKLACRSRLDLLRLAMATAPPLRD